LFFTGSVDDGVELGEGLAVVAGLPLQADSASTHATTVTIRRMGTLKGYRT
jgi:hypothetical protein